MLAALMLLAAAEPAHAQAATAYAAFPFYSEPEGRHRLALEGGDFVLLRRLGEHAWAVERYSRDLALLWSTPLTLEDPRNTLLEGLESAFNSEGLEGWPDRALLSNDREVVLVAASDTGVRAWRLDAQKGGVLAEEDLAVTSSRPGLFLSEGRHAVAAFTGGTRKDPLQAWVWDESLHLIREGSLSTEGLLRDVQVDAFGRRTSELNVHIALDDRGGVYMLASGRDREIALRRIDAGGEQTLTADLGDGDLSDLSMAFGASGRVYITATLSEMKLLSDRHAGVGVAALDFGAGELLWTHTVSPDRFFAARSPDSEPIADELDWHNPVALVEAPDGTVALVTQFQAMRTTTNATGTVTTTAVEFQDLAVYALNADGTLRWTTGLDVDQALPAGIAAPQIGKLFWAGDDTLRLVIMETQSKLFGTDRFVSLREVRLADGAVEPRQVLIDLPSRDDVFFEDLTLPLDEDTVVLVMRVGGDEALGLIARVELSAEPPESAPLFPSLTPNTRAPDYRAGYVVGTRDGQGANIRTAIGLAAGGPMGVGGTMGGALLAPLGPWACVAGPAIGCVGGAALAAALPAGVADAPVAHFSPEFQAGYLDGYRKAARRKQVRWAIIGAGAGVAVAILPATALAGALGSPTP